jgi:hypothetical protein
MTLDEMFETYSEHVEHCETCVDVYSTLAESGTFPHELCLMGSALRLAWHNMSDRTESRKEAR